MTPSTSNWFCRRKPRGRSGHGQERILQSKISQRLFSFNSSVQCLAARISRGCCDCYSNNTGSYCHCPRYYQYCQPITANANANTNANANASAMPVRVPMPLVFLFSVVVVIKWFAIAITPTPVQSKVLSGKTKIRSECTRFHAQRHFKTVNQVVNYIGSNYKHEIFSYLIIFIFLTKYYSNIEWRLCCITTKVGELLPEIP